jgi:hypothetical protein
LKKKQPLQVSEPLPVLYFYSQSSPFPKRKLSGNRVKSAPGKRMTFNYSLENQHYCTMNWQVFNSFFCEFGTCWFVSATPGRHLKHGFKGIDANANNPRRYFFRVLYHCCSMPSSSLALIAVLPGISLTRISR